MMGGQKIIHAEIFVKLIKSNQSGDKKEANKEKKK